MAVTTRAGQDAGENRRSALAHSIQTMGEAARRASRKCQDRHSEIPRVKIIGMRHNVVHEELSVDHDLVWDAVTVNLPQLAIVLDRIVPPGGPT
jgi:uncharacterized protein with HEPN domain